MVLPEPLGPRIPTLSPRMIMVLKSWTMTLSGQEKARSAGADHQPAALVAVLQLNARLARLLSAATWRSSRISIKDAHPALVAGPAIADTLADPDLFFGQLAIERRPLILARRAGASSRRTRKVS